jgi:hypothetical protein
MLTVTVTVTISNGAGRTARESPAGVPALEPRLTVNCIVYPTDFVWGSLYAATKTLTVTVNCNRNVEVNRIASVHIS